MGHSRKLKYGYGLTSGQFERNDKANLAYVDDFNAKANEVVNNQKAVKFTGIMETAAPRTVVDPLVPKGYTRYRFPDGFVCIAKNQAKAVKMRKEFITANNNNVDGITI